MHPHPGGKGKCSAPGSASSAGRLPGHDGPGRKSWLSAARGAWVSDDTFQLKLALCETPFCPVIACRFDGDRVTCDVQGSIGFGPAQRPALEGREVP